MPRNEASDNTIMKDVPPGDETGVYYILLGGLPFGTIWQLLKDWLRDAGCDVDHIEVFQKSTSGWVRLVGKDNFERALQHLRTTAYNNRLLLYLDKNRSEPVKIMELIDDPPPKSRGKLPVKHVKTSCHQKNEEERHGESDAALIDYRKKRSEPLWMPSDLHSMFGTDPFGMSRWSLQHSSYFTPGYPPQQPSNLPFSSGQPSSSSSCPILDPTEARPSKTSARSGNATTPLSSDGKQPHAKEGRFKVQISPLKPTASPQHVEQWVRLGLGQWSATMCTIDIPMDHRTGRIQGSIYITFASAAAAKMAVDALNQCVFLDRTVHARLIDECDRSKVRGRTTTGPRRAATAVYQPEDGLPTAAHPQDAGIKTNGRYSGPVIAHGTNYWRR